MAGIYIHVPFCVRRCIYCDFYSTTQRELIPAFVQALTQEIRLRASYLKQSDGSIAPIGTVYFGGGTPSLLSIDALSEIFGALYNTYAVSSQSEITLEANPDDLTPAYIARLRHVPINRLSIGIQTLNDDLLHFLHRRHSACQAVEAVRNCQKEGFNNLSVDLIFGIPGQTLQSFKRDLETIIGLHVPHISAYSLTFEKGTPLWQMRERKRVGETDEELSLSMYNLLIDTLTAHGYEHYEISNFALPGFRAQHNSNYWRGVPYLGCGPSAHSYDGHSRQWNKEDLLTYINMVQKCSKGEDFCSCDGLEKETLNMTDKYNERIITSLRTCEGIDIGNLKKDFGNELADYCLRTAVPYLQKGLLACDCDAPTDAPSRLRLTRKGLFLSDSIISDLFFVRN